MHNASLAEIAKMLLGEPNKALSTSRQLRYGRKGSLAVDLERARFRDFEADTGGDGIDLVRHVLACDYKSALAFIGSDRPAIAHRPANDRHKSDKDRTAAALAIWSEAIDPRGTLAETYLHKRKLALLPGVVGDVIRFHPRCPFGTERLPCMVALFRDVASNEPVAIHRTAISATGEKIGKKMQGPVAGAAIKLTDDADITTGLGIAEGIETALSVMQAGWSAVWALGSAGAIDAFPVLSGIEALTVFSDHDDAGLKAARNLARRWADADRDSYLQAPRMAGADFNDILKVTDNA